MINSKVYHTRQYCTVLYCTVLRCVSRVVKHEKSNRCRTIRAIGKAKFSDLLIPWATFTEPEVAHVGLYPRDMKAKNVAFDTYVKKVNQKSDAAVPDMYIYITASSSPEWSSR